LDDASSTRGARGRMLHPGRLPLRSSVREAL
jgi:hypothetical protein